MNKIKDVLFTIILCFMAVNVDSQAPIGSNVAKLSVDSSVGASASASASANLSKTNKTDAGSNCFYDTIANVYAKIEKKMNKFISFCNLGTSNDLNLLLNAANAIGRLEAYNGTRANSIPLNVVNDLKTATNQANNWTFLTRAKALIASIPNDTSMINIDSVDDSIWSALSDDWDKVSKVNDYPVSFKSDVMVIVKSKRQLSILETRYGNQSQLCLPSDYSFLTNLNEITSNVGDKFSPISDCKTEAVDFSLDPVYLSKEGIGVTFWLTENLQMIGNQNITVFEAYVKNRKILDFSIFKEKDYLVGNRFVIFDKTLTIPSNSTCADMVFVVMSFQKDCDHYRFIVSMKFLGSNTKFFYETNVTAREIENAKLNFVKPYVNNIKMYKDFSYSSTRELVLMSSNTDTEKMKLIIKTGQNCMRASPGCLYKLPDSSCQTCVDYMFNINGTCVENCPAGYFPTKNNTCAKCDSKCSACSSSLVSDCSECFSPFVLFNTTCQAKCPDNMMPVNGTCKQCTDNCSVCRDEITCKDCKPDTYLLDGKCVKECTRGYYKDTNPNVCKPCQDSCQICSGIDKCSVCSDGFFLQNGKCVRNCGDFFYGDVATKSCQPCPKFCKSCSDSVYCKSCQDGFYLTNENKTCVSECPINTINYSGTCIKCKNPACNYCDANNVAICTQCNKTTYLKEGDCVNSCGDGYYADGSVCKKCSFDCKTCGKDKCFQCIPGKYVFNDTSCVSNCPDGYIESGGVCLKCKDPSTCKKCSETNLGVCTKCYTDKFILEGQCVSTCPSSYFPIDNKCEKCVDGCDVCKDAIICKNCFSGYSKKGNICVKDCGVGYVSINGICTACTVTDCATCDVTNPGTCNKCLPGKYLYANKCYDKCPARTYYNTDMTCKDCIADCDQCDDSRTCKKCLSPKVLQGNQCVTECADSSIPINGVCVLCKNASCRRCDALLDKCTECIAGKKLYQGDCLDRCPETTYLRANTCVDCVKPCLTCSDNTTCITCIPGFAKYNNTCTDNCPDGTVKVKDSCETCTAANCTKCNSPSVDQCINCKNNTFLLNGNCYNICPNNYYSQNGACYPCLAGCKSCTGPNQCNLCEDGKFLKDKTTCTPTCGEGYVSDIKNKVCIKCTNNCKECKVDDPNYCTACISTYGLYMGTCRTECPDGTYKNTTTGSCDPCSVSNCAKCPTGTICNKCSAGLLLKENSCVPAPCPDGYTMNNDKCLKCEVAKCKTCPSDNTKVCTSCITNNFLISGTESKCDTECPAGTFKNLNNQKCEPCEANCLYCKDSTTCTKCDTNFYLYKDDCVKQCPSGYNRVDDKCIKCTVDNCQTCKGNINTCDVCEPPYLLSNNTCVSNCPSTTFASNGICKPCPLFCQNCKDENTCITCAPNKVLTTDYKCTDTCPDGTINRQGICIKCQANDKCKKCDVNDLTKCLECTNNLVLYNNTCISNCPSRTFEEQKVCKACVENCAKCSSSTSCDACDNTYYLFDNKCLNDCPVGFYKFMGKCVRCDTNCDQCNSSACTKCTKGSYLENGVCKTQCSRTYYLNNNIECLPCGENCLDCLNSASCTLCKEGFFLKNGLCVKECGSGYTTVNNVCLACDKDCEICDPKDRTKCLKCSEKSVLYNFSCLSSCPVGWYKDKNSECKKCLDKCDLCDNSDTCQKCQGGSYLAPDSKKCGSDCPDGYRPENGVCAPCQTKQCKKCQTSVTTCDQCIAPNLLDANTCVPICPEGKFRTEASTCDKCPAECKTCQDKNNCKSCIDTFVLNKGKCTSSCEPGQAVVRGECQDCKVEGCKVCDVTLVNCLACSGNRVLMVKNSTTTCVEDCGEGYYTNSTKVCNKCGDNCSKCTNDKECNDCRSGFVLQDGKCKERCDPFYVERNGKCIKCESPQCLVCDNLMLKLCKKCDVGYALKGTDCTSDCGDSFYKFKIDTNTTVCKACIGNCKKCLDEKSCEECNVNFYKKANECVSACGDNYALRDNKVCVKCTDPNCKVCDKNSPDICLKCSSPFLLQESKCVNQCNEGYYNSFSDLSCVPCTDANCVKCSPRDVCTVCKAGKFVFNDKCVLECPVGYVSNSENVCTPCADSNCLKCASEKPGKCQVCKTGLLYDGTCVTTCPAGYFANSLKECQRCLANCATCLNATSCTSCNSTFVLSAEGTCTDKCPNNQVQINTTCVYCSQKTCEKCDPKNVTNCLVCNADKFLYNGTCVDSCPKSTFISGRNCLDCNKKCSACKDLNTCYNCTSPYVLQGDVCVTACNSGYTASKNSTCILCSNPDKCETCLSDDLNTCTICKSGFFLDNGLCLTKCSPGKYQNEKNICVACTENCNECLSISDCKSCIAGKVLLNGKCINTCPSGFVAVLGVCKQCSNINCLTCDLSNLAKCIQCNNSTLLYNNECVVSCPEKYYKNGTVCAPCDAKCQQCVNSETCTKCVNPYVLDNGKCASDCPSGKVPREDQCLSCADPSCKVCATNNLNKCLQCEKGFLLNDICVNTCPDGYRGDDSTKTCVKCSENCLKCNAQGCLTCMKDFYFAENTKSCITCKVPFLVINNTCVSCKVEGCLKCNDTNPNACSICDSSKVLVDGKCLATCPEGTYKSGQSCFECSEKCLACNDDKTCTKCSGAYVLFNGKCVSSCPDNFVSNDNGVCLKCAQDECLKCNKNDLKSCEVCKSGTYRYNNICYTVCPDGTFNLNGTCSNCPASCAKCDGSKCLSCKQGFKMKNGECVAQCGDGFVDSGSVCVQCTDVNCILCNPASVCQKCNNSTYLFVNEGTCKATCPEGTYTDTVNRQCIGCDKGCVKCDASKCLACAKNLFLENGRCVQKCADGSTNLNGVCVTCSQKECLQCYNENPQKCLKCSNSTFLYNQTCINQCPKGTYQTSNKTCVDCDPTCADCLDADTCTSCKAEFTLLNGKCVNNCPDGKVKYNGKCISCADEKCKTCLVDTTLCVSCRAPYKLLNGECRESCPDGYYQGNNNDCQRCLDTCEKCTNSTYCTKCSPGFYMLNNTCVSSCGKKMFGDCANRICGACNEACEDCNGYSADNCLKCASGYYRNDRSCVKPEKCRIGTFPSNKTNTCERCMIPFCYECIDENTCKTCLRGFQMKNGECVEAHTFANVIKESQLFSTYTSKNQINRESFNFNTQLQGIAVGNPTVSFSFWIRKLKPSTPGTIVFSTKNNSTSPSPSIYMRFGGSTNTSQLCEFVVLSSDSKMNVLQTVDCSFSGLYNWRYFLITFAKNRDNTAVLRVKIYTAGKFQDYILNIPVDLTDLIQKDTSIIFNTNNIGNDAFEITNVNVLDYYPDDNEISKFFTQVPDTCDYMCSDCSSGQCNACANGKINSDGYCPASYIPVKSIVTNINSDIVFNIREKLTKRYVSDRYALALMFYITNIDEARTLDVASLHYNTVDNVKTNNNLVLSIKIVDKKLVINDLAKFDNPPILGNTWYVLSVGVKDNYSIVYLKDWTGQTNFKQEYSFYTNIMKAYDDLVITLGNTYNTNSTTHIKGSMFDSRFYLNNLPNDTEITSFYSGLKCPSNCAVCGQDFSCVTCENGYASSKDGTCVDNTVRVGTVLLQKLTVWRNEALDIKLPEDQITGNFAISFWLRKKKRASNLTTPAVHNILSVLNPTTGAKVPLLTESHGPAFTSTFNMNSINGVISSVNHSFDEEVPKYMLVVVNFDYKTSLLYFTFRDGDKSFNAQGPINFKFNTIYFGDNTGGEMYNEIGLVNIYKATLRPTDLNNILDKYPKDCDPACIDCDYSTGICRVCIQKNAKSYNVPKCPAYLSGFSSVNVFNVVSYNSIPNKETYNAYIKGDFKMDVNSLNYAIIGYIRILDMEKILSQGNGRYTLAEVSNIDTNIAIPNYPGNDLISIVYMVQNSVGSLNWEIENKGKVQVIPFNPQPNLSKSEWLLVYGGISVIDKTFKYKFSMNNVVLGTGSVILPSYPEMLSERSVFRVFDIGGSLEEDSKMPNGQMNEFYLIVNNGYVDALFEAFKNTKVPPPNPTCPTGCSRCIVDENKDVLCLVCTSGFTLKNNVCKSNEPQAISYLALSDKSDDLSLPVVYAINQADVLKTDGYTIIFYIRRNYLINRNNKANILTFGTLKIDMNYGSETNLLISDIDNFSTSLGPLDNNSNIDYRWYLVVINISPKTVVSTISSLTDNFTKSVKANLSKSVKADQKVIISAPESEWQISGLHIAGDIVDSSLLPPPSATDCAPDCAVCLKGICQSCIAGVDKDGQCRPVNTRLPNTVLNTANTQNSFKLSDFVGTQHVIRSQQFTVFFSWESNSKGDYIRLLKLSSSSSDKDETNVTKFLTLHYQRSQNKYFVRIYNRLISIKGGSYEFSFAYPSTPANTIHYVAISYDGDEDVLTTVAYNSLSNTVRNKYSIPGASEFVTNNAFIYLSDYFSTTGPGVGEYITYRDFSIQLSNVYKTAETLHNMMSNEVYDFQPKCTTFTRNACTICQNFISGDVCSPVTNSISHYLNNIETISYIHNSVATKYKSVPVNKFTLSFWWRRNAYENNRFGVIKVTQPNFKGSTDGIYLSIEYSANTFSIIGRVGTVNTLVVSNVYDTSEQFDWLHVTVTYDIIANNLQAFVVNQRSKRTATKFGNLNVSNNGVSAGIPVSPTSTETLYSYTIGYTDNTMSSPSETYNFEIASIIFTPNYIFPADTLDNFRVKPPQKCTDTCKEPCVDGVCPEKSRITSYITVGDLFVGSDVKVSTDIKVINSQYLFRLLGPLYQVLNNMPSDSVSNLNLNARNNFIINFEMDIASFLKSTYSSNKDLLFVVSNNINTNLSNLKMSDLIPESVFKFAVFSVEHRNGNLRVYTGSNLQSNTVNFYDVSISKGIKNYNKLYLSINIDTVKNFAKMSIFLDDLEITYDLNLTYSAQPLTISTAFYNHPSVSNIKVNVHNPRGDFDREKSYGLSKNALETNASSNICGSSSTGCIKCLYSTVTTKITCTKCDKGYKLHEDVCIKEYIQAPTSTKTLKLGVEI